MSRRDTWCRYRTPFTKDFKVCGVGVDFHQFEGPDTYRAGRPGLMPCLGECVEAIARCDKYSGWTPEEIAEREAQIELRMKRIGTIRAAIIATMDERGHKTGVGSMPCPCCKTGQVNYSRASNGHVHARCSTDGCASWME